MAVGEPASTSWRGKPRNVQRCMSLAVPFTATRKSSAPLVPIVPHLQVKACRSSTGVGGVSQECDVWKAQSQHCHCLSHRAERSHFLYKMSKTYLKLFVSDSWLDISNAYLDTLVSSGQIHRSPSPSLKVSCSGRFEVHCCYIVSSRFS